MTGVNLGIRARRAIVLRLTFEIRRYGGFFHVEAQFNWLGNSLAPPSRRL